VLDHRHPVHHVLLAQLVQRVEVQMVVELMPQPGLLVLARSETEDVAIAARRGLGTRRRHGSIEVVDVEMVGAALDLDQQASALIPHPQDATFDPHLRSSFIQPTKAQDGVPSAGM